MKKLLLTLAIATATQFAPAQTFNPLLADMLQDTLSTYVAFIPSIKGMSASVYVPGQGLWQGTAGVSYTGQPITPEMEFGIASNTKLFVSTVMLMLQEDAIIDLDDPINMYLADHANVDPDITIRQLLNHTSGVTDPIFYPPWMDTIMANPTRYFTNEEVLSWLGAPANAPGAGWYYSNVNYILAGMVAESATGTPIYQLIRDRILTPLDMDSTFYDVEEPETGTLAHRWYNTIDYNDTSRVGLNSAGGCAGSLFSTSAEMAKWYYTLLTGDLLNAASLAELTDFVETGTPGYAYGLGFSRETTIGRTYWGHGGTTWGYRSKMMFDTCRAVVVCGLCNSWPAGDEGVVFLLYQLIDNHLPACGGPVSGVTTVCQGETGITYTVPAILHATSYQWTLPSGATGTSATNSITVDYGLTAVSGNISVEGVSDYGNGPATSLFITINPKPAQPVITQTGSTLHSSAPAGNQWYNTAGLIPGATAQDYIIPAEDDYYVIVTQSGCSSEASETLHAQPDGIYMLGNIDAINVFPNPVTDFCTITNSNSTEIFYSLLNTSGQCIQSGQGNSSITLSVRDLPPGMYLLMLNQQKTTLSMPLVKL